MPKKELFSVVSVMLLGLIMGGCVSMRNLSTVNKEHIVLTGLFDNDLKKMADKFKEIKTDMAMDEVIKLGFDPTAPNVEKLPGADGSKYMLGTDQIKINVSDPKDYKKHILERQRYDTWVFPYIISNTEEKSSFFGSNKKSKKTGPEHLFVIIFYDGKVLIKKDPETARRELKSEKSSAVGGVFKSLFRLGLKYGL